ncbi:MAG: hypothetical protein IKX99_07225 [Lachnospiraceae bacterium]|nr:hypothetical protein [Lachnospiraceae bacterium]MBO4462481.1 hypothetical protein [Lachnospiraceae bacterium]MBR5789878.1 hypothetical protein [Lachnospiraceae bacterium]
MLLLKLPDVKSAMNTLLTTNSFDNFLVSEITIVNSVTYNIDGHVVESDDNDLTVPLMPYEKLRPIVLSMIKGNKTPSYMKFILTLSPENIANTAKSIGSPTNPEDITGMYLNIVFQNGSLNVTTGIAYRSFMKDVALEKEWDRLLPIFLNKSAVSYEIL